MNIAIILASLLVAEGDVSIQSLVWVNPVRCLPQCAVASKNVLVTTNEAAHPDPHGKFRFSIESAAPMRGLLADGRRAGHALSLRESSRSYGSQAFVFRKYKEAGRAARPGHSEHELEGEAFDLVIPTLAAIDWIAENAYKHGFTVSYPRGKQRVTGYRAEPWHIRFVGVALATELYRRGITLEEWFREKPERGISGDCGKCPLPESIPPPCGNVTAAGSCRQHILTWCYDGALARVDCSVSDERCGKDEVSGNFACLAR